MKHTFREVQALLQSLLKRVSTSLKNPRLQMRPSIASVKSTCWLRNCSTCQSASTLSLLKWSWTTTCTMKSTRSSRVISLTSRSGLWWPGPSSTPLNCLWAQRRRSRKCVSFKASCLMPSTFIHLSSSAPPLKVSMALCPWFSSWKSLQSKSVTGRRLWKRQAKTWVKLTSRPWPSLRSSSLSFRTMRNRSMASALKQRKRQRTMRTSQRLREPGRFRTSRLVLTEKLAVESSRATP